ncbi:lysozyme inhibitor LprI family protein [Stenotrophomonas sp. LARHCG68]
MAAPEHADYDRMYSDCVDRAGTLNNGVVDACSSTTSEHVKAEMNALYKRIHDRLSTQSPQDADRLEQAQKSWLVYRNTHCDLAGAYVGSPMYAFCPMQLNIARVAELRELAGD